MPLMMGEPPGEWPWSARSPLLQIEAVGGGSPGVEMGRRRLRCATAQR